MPAVITLTLSPALDKTTTVAGLVPDQKLHCTEPTLEAGGGGINVSRGLRRLGTLSVAVFPAAGATGTCLQEMLTAEGVAHRAVPTACPVRENFVVLDTATHRQYRFGMPSAPLTVAEQHQVLEALESFVQPPAFLVVSGSLPAGVAPAFVARVVRRAVATGIKVVADTSGPALRQAIEAGAYLIKPNLGELSQLAGVAELDNSSLVGAARGLLRAGGCEIVLVSMGARGAFLVTRDVAELIPAPAVKTRSTVGAGDSVVAGFVHALAQGQPVREAARLGVACGTAATLNPGTELFHRPDAEKLYHWLLRTMPAEGALVAG